jgi:hypothetical protein
LVNAQPPPNVLELHVVASLASVPGVRNKVFHDNTHEKERHLLKIILPFRFLCLRVGQVPVFQVAGFGFQYLGFVAVKFGNRVPSSLGTVCIFLRRGVKGTPPPFDRKRAIALPFAAHAAEAGPIPLGRPSLLAC